MNDNETKNLTQEAPVGMRRLEFAPYGDGSCSVKGGMDYKDSSIFIPEVALGGRRVEKIENGAFEGYVELRSIELPRGIKIIDDSAFKGCSALVGIELPDTLEIIGPNAFADCTGVSEIKLPESLTVIGAWAFAFCLRLRHVVLPKRITKINDLTFYCCAALQEISIPIGVTAIGDQVFLECKALNVIRYEGTLARWSSIYKGRGWNAGTKGVTVICSDGEMKLP